MDPGPVPVPVGMEKPKLTVPTVHLNGTSFAGLYDPLLHVRVKLSEVIDSLAECAPHGRDYYLQDDGAHARARDEHLSRIARLQSVLDEVKVLARQVQKQEGSRGRPPVPGPTP